MTTGNKGDGITETNLAAGTCSTQHKKRPGRSAEQGDWERELCHWRRGKGHLERALYDISDEVWITKYLSDPSFRFHCFS